MYHSETVIFLRMTDVLTPFGLYSSTHGSALPDNKDPRINVDKISIRRESVGSISNRHWSDNLCYLGCDKMQSIAGWKYNVILIQFTTHCEVVWLDYIKKRCIPINDVIRYAIFVLLVANILYKSRRRLLRYICVCYKTTFHSDTNVSPFVSVFPTKLYMFIFMANTLITMINSWLISFKMFT